MFARKNKAGFHINIPSENADTSNEKENISRLKLMVKLIGL